MSDLVEEYKRRGEFDKKRRELLAAFEAEDGINGQLDQLLSEFLDSKVNDNPSLLENRGKLIASLQASLTRGGQDETSVIGQINQLLEAYVDKALDGTQIELDEAPDGS